VILDTELWRGTHLVAIVVIRNAKAMTEMFDGQSKRSEGSFVYQM